MTNCSELTLDFKTGSVERQLKIKECNNNVDFHMTSFDKMDEKSNPITVYYFLNPEELNLVCGFLNAVNQNKNNEI